MADVEFFPRVPANIANVQRAGIAIGRVWAAAAGTKRRAERVSQGNLVRRALRAYGVTPDPETDKTGHDVIKHLIGKNRGKSKDLSTNPKHLKDYGR